MLILMTLQEEYRPSIDIEQLLLEIAHGDQEALAALYDQTRAAVYGLALSFLRSAHDAEDVTQDTFVRIWENAPAYRPQGHAMAWILTVARNLCKMRLRSQEKVTDLPEEVWLSFPAPGDAVTTEDRLVLTAALQGLSAEERRIVLLHAASGLKHREIAQLLELPLATVLSKYHRALKKLRTSLKGEE